MRPSVGTVAQLAHATGIAVTTIHAYARQGRITRTGWHLTPAGHLVAVYDAHDVVRTAAERAQARRRAPRRTPPDTCAAPQCDTRSDVRS